MNQPVRSSAAIAARTQQAHCLYAAAGRGLHPAREGQASTATPPRLINAHGGTEVPLACHYG